MDKVISLIEKVKEDNAWVRKILIGSIIMFIPFVNIFALGYIFRYVGRILDNREYALPDWDNWPRLFFGGLIFLAILLGGVLFLGLAYLIAAFLTMLSGGILGWFFCLPFAAAVAVVPSMVVLASVSFRKGHRYNDFYKDVWTRMSPLRQNWLELLLLNLLVIGLILVGLPVYGFGFFVGFLLLVAYTIGVLENQ